MKLVAATKVDEAMRQLCTARGWAGSRGRYHGVRTGPTHRRQRTNLRCVAGPGWPAAIDGPQDTPGFGRRDGAG